MSNQRKNNKTDSPRKGEQDKSIIIRSSRFFTVGRNWYFSTREGIDRGPFNKKEYAKDAINNYIQEMQVLERDNV